MGQEILEDKPWSDTPSPDTSIWWAGLDGGDKSMSDFLRFTRELIGVRRSHPGLRGEGCAIIHVHDDNRVLAFQRWVDGIGDAVVVVCSLNERTWYGPTTLASPVRDAGSRYSTVTSMTIGSIRLSLETAARWTQMVRPCTASNSASLTIPANGLLVFARS